MHAACAIDTKHKTSDDSMRRLRVSPVASESGISRAYPCSESAVGSMSVSVSSISHVENYQGEYWRHDVVMSCPTYVGREREKEGGKSLANMRPRRILALLKWRPLCVPAASPPPRVMYVCAHRRLIATCERWIAYFWEN